MTKTENVTNHRLQRSGGGRRFGNGNVVRRRPLNRVVYFCHRTMAEKTFRLRFSLRVLLCVITALALWMGWLIPRAQQQKRAVEWVESHGGQVFYRFQTDEKCEPKRGINPPGPKFLRDLIGIDYLSTVDVVYLNRQPLDDLSKVRAFRRLRYFQMSNQNGQHKDISPLANCKNLERLYLAHYPIGDISSLRSLKRLKQCTIFAIPELEGVAVLASLPQLEELTLRSTNVDSIEPFLNHPSLKTATIEDCPVSDSDIAELQRSIHRLKSKR